MKKQIMSIMSAAAFAVQLAVPYTAFAKSENVTKFIFSDSGIGADDGDYTGYKISGTDLTINSGGTYEVSGSCADGSITVKKGTTGVNLILNGITLSSKDTAPICFNKSSEVTLTAKEGSVNTLSDSGENNDDNYPDNTNAENAVIKCKDGSDVVIDGSGTINITANGKNGIKSGASTDEDGDASLTVKEAVLNIEAPVNDAINAEAELNIKSGSLNISAADDAVHSDYTLNIDNNGRPQPPQFGENNGDMQPPQGFDGSGNTGTSVSISVDDKLVISDSNGTVCSATAVRSANYVFYSDSSLSEDETYTLKINDTEAAKSTVSDSKNTQSGMQPPQGGFGRQDGNRPQDSFREDNKKDNSTDKKNGFKDVSEDSWYNNAIWYIFEKNLMNGITDEEFSPDSTITRAMFVTVLYRMENEPETTGKNKFTDVSDDAYYRDAVIWAAENGIVNGITENEFEPDKSISREEMAAIAYRYAKYKGADLQTNKSEKYDDDEKISDFAKESVSWAASKGIMNGSDGKFTPKNGSTRAQAATVFMRLIENLK